LDFSALVERGEVLPGAFEDVAAEATDEGEGHNGALVDAYEEENKSRDSRNGESQQRENRGTEGPQRNLCDDSKEKVAMRRKFEIITNDKKKGRD
jgi:hypothetical protein